MSVMLKVRALKMSEGKILITAAVEDLNVIKIAEVIIPIGMRKSRLKFQMKSSMAKEVTE